jgi:hypothetical protein
MGGKIKVTLDFDVDEVKRVLGSGGELKVLSDDEIKKLEQGGLTFGNDTPLGQRMLFFKLIAKFKQYPDFAPKSIDEFNPKLEYPRSVFEQVPQQIPMHNGLFCADQVLGLDRGPFKKQ